MKTVHSVYDGGCHKLQVRRFGVPNRFHRKQSILSLQGLTHAQTHTHTHSRTHSRTHTPAHTQVSNNERRPSLLPGLQGPVQGLHVAFGDLQELRVRQLGPPPQLEGGSRGSMWEGFASGAALPPHYDWVLKNGSPLTSGRC